MSDGEMYSEIYLYLWLFGVFKWLDYLTKVISSLSPKILIVLYSTCFLLQIWRAVVESHSPTEWVVHNQGYDADIEPGADYQVDFVARAAGDQAGTVTYFIEGKPETYSYICTIRNTSAIITFPSSPGIAE